MTFLKTISDVNFALHIHMQKQCDSKSNEEDYSF